MHSSKVELWKYGDKLLLLKEAKEINIENKL